MIEKDCPTNFVDLGKVLFSGDTTVQLWLCLKSPNNANSLDVEIDPFEIVNLGVGRRYYLAKLIIGGNFYQQYILLNAFSPTQDKAALAEIEFLSAFGKQPNNPFPKSICFNVSFDNEHLYAPVFYCKRQKQFFHACCENCGGAMRYSVNTKTIYCHKCKQENHFSAHFSLLDLEQSNTNLTLEELFESFGRVRDSEIFFPCIGCARHQQCYETKKNDRIDVFDVPIVPFSFNAFALYGFSYFPLRILDYCELLSGRRKSELLESISQSSEQAKYKVLLETQGVMKELNVREFLISEKPEIATVLLIKLRSFLRLCISIQQMTQKWSLAHGALTVNNIMMDIVQEYSAGDSVTRAKILLMPPGSRKTPTQAFELKNDESRIWQSSRFGLEKVVSKTDDPSKVFLFANLLVDEGARFAVNDVVHVRYSGVEGFIQSMVTSFVVKEVNGDVLQLESLEYYDAPVLIKQFSILQHVPGFEVKYVSVNNGSIKDDCSALSKILLMVLFSNQELNELKLEESIICLCDILDQLNMTELTESDLGQALLASTTLSSIFRQDNILYHSVSDGEGKINYNIWLRILMIVIKLSHRVSCCNYLMQTATNDQKNVLTLVIADLKNVISQINSYSSRENYSFEADDKLMVNVLSEIVDDPNWLSSVLSMERVQQSDNNQSTINPVSTVPDGNIELDETVILRNLSQGHNPPHSFSKVLNDVDSTEDETVIMKFPINRWSQDDNEN